MSSQSVVETQIYDHFEGPEVDAAKWAPLPVFLPDGSVRSGVEPSAVTVVAGGSMSVTVEKFETSHDSFQQADNIKHVVVSTQAFTLPEHGVATFAVDQAVTRLGPRRPDDVMLALAAFNVIEPERGLVFDVLSNGIDVYVVHEQLSGVPNPAGPPYTHLIRDPFIQVAVRPGVPNRCEVEFDTRAQTVRWLADGVEIYRCVGAPMPKQVILALGLMSGQLIRDGASVSLEGQGLSATWSAPSVSITEG